MHETKVGLSSMKSNFSGRVGRWPISPAPGVLNTAVTYGKVGSAANPFFIVPPTSSSYTAQIGSELYYRPETFGYRNGALFEVFGRGFMTLYDESGGPTGGPTTQGMVGARWKPLAEQNLVLEVDKLFKLGEFARDDFLLRAAYSYSVGTDLRVVAPSWLTWIVYGEVDYYTQHPQLIMLAEGRFGRSFRIDSINKNLVFFPHAVVARRLRRRPGGKASLFSRRRRIIALLVWRDAVYGAALILRTDLAISFSP